MSSATEGEPEPEEQDDDAGEESTWLKLRTDQHLPLGSCPAALWC
jgi:hypothetical protein